MGAGTNVQSRLVAVHHLDVGWKPSDMTQRNGCLLYTSYPFADQLMIYAQRPDATACADFDIWNNRMNRYVRRGAKGCLLYTSRCV